MLAGFYNEEIARLLTCVVSVPRALIKDISNSSNLQDDNRPVHFCRRFYIADKLCLGLHHIWPSCEGPTMSSSLIIQQACSTHRRLQTSQAGPYGPLILPDITVLEANMKGKAEGLVTWTYELYSPGCPKFEVITIWLDALQIRASRRVIEYCIIQTTYLPQQISERAILTMIPVYTELKVPVRN